MNVTELKSLLLWCAIADYAVLLLWAGFFVGAHGWLYRLHSRWFRLPVETFDALHYAGMTVFKTGALLFFVVPLVALHATT